MNTNVKYIMSGLLAMAIPFLPMGLDKVFKSEPKAHLISCDSKTNSFYDNIVFPKSVGEKVQAFANATDEDALIGYSDSCKAVWKDYYHECQENNPSETTMSRMGKVLEGELGISSSTCRELVKARAQEIRYVICQP